MSDIKKINVNGTLYDVAGGGSALYKHYLKFQDNDEGNNFYAPLLHSYAESLTLAQVKQIILAQGLANLFPPVEAELEWGYGLPLDNGVILYLYGLGEPSESGFFGIERTQYGFTTDVELLSDTVKDISLPQF